MLWLLFPALAHVLFAAHLLFHGAALWVVALPVAALVLAFVPVRYMNRLQQLCLLGYACEWAYSTYELVARRILEGRSYHPALEIMADALHAPHGPRLLPSEASRLLSLPWTELKAPFRRREGPGSSPGPCRLRVGGSQTGIIRARSSRAPRVRREVP